MDENSKDTVWWTSDEFKNDNHPCSEDTWKKLKEIAVKELSRMLNGFLDSLDKESRIMFVRRYWYSDSISQIAKKFGISNNNVSVRLSRIREKLKNYLRKEGYSI